jgi:hypothetical protein
MLCYFKTFYTTVNVLYPTKEIRRMLAQADNGDILAAPFSRSDAEADMFEGIGTEAARLAYKDIADHMQVGTYQAGCLLWTTRDMNEKLHWTVFEIKENKPR